MRAPGLVYDDVTARPNMRAAALVLLLAALGLAACEGDTLYTDEPVAETPPPLVEIVTPVSGVQVTAGRVVGVQIAAEDTLGVAEIELSYRGVTTGTIRFTFVPPRLSVVVDTVIVVPPATTGTLELRATSTNSRGTVGRAELVTLPVALSDTIAPSVALTATVPARVEMTDSVRVRITARDNDGGTGLTRVGLTVLVARPASADTMVLERIFDIAPPQRGDVIRDVAFAPPFVDARNVPVELNLSLHAFAVDSAGNCAAAVGATGQRLPCGEFRTHTVASGLAPAIPTTVVAGRSVPLPAGSVIRDAAVDVPRERLYLSNLQRSRIEVMNLRTHTFGSPVNVGSQPWGVHVNRTGDTLIVANSGGTSLSYVFLGGEPREIVSSRVHTPNVNLFEVGFFRDANGVERYNVNFLDFSDRPQFVAQDAFGRLLYSTFPTAAAPLGTMRLADRQPGWQAPEVRILLGRNVTVPDSFTISVINVDSMRVFTSTAGDLIEIYDHRSGFPGTIVRSGIKTLRAALDSLTTDPNSDIVWIAGRFDRTLVGLADTTYVAASGNRNRVAFGEGARGNGRVFMWEAPVSEISNEITVADLVGNTAEHIVGIELNQDGTLATARGIQAAYYFKEDLRLQGHFDAATAANGSGAGLHPDHPSYAGFPPSGSSTLGFVATGRALKIVDTVHFFERGDIPLRDNIVGPLRVSRPLAGETAGCPGPDCLVARVYGVTDGGAVVLIDVRSRDIR